MFAHRTATGLTIALLALPATATAQPSPSQSLADHYGWGQTQVKTDQRPHPFAYEGAGLPTSSLAGTTSPLDLRSPDAADAARAGEIAKAMEHYERSQPATTAASDDSPAWPEIAFAGVVLLVTAGAFGRARQRRSRRVAA